MWQRLLNFLDLKPVPVPEVPRANAGTKGGQCVISRAAAAAQAASSYDLCPNGAALWAGVAVMNLLFIHGNFPGQFLDLAPLLAQKAGGRTVFLTESENPQGIQLPGVELVRFGCHRDGATMTATSICVVPSKRVLRGQAVLRALQQLQEQGFVPDVVIAHGGMWASACL